MGERGVGRWGCGRFRCFVGVLVRWKGGYGFRVQRLSFRGRQVVGLDRMVAYYYLHGIGDGNTSKGDSLT